MSCIEDNIIRDIQEHLSFKDHFTEPYLQVFADSDDICIASFLAHLLEKYFGCKVSEKSDDTIEIKTKSKTITIKMKSERYKLIVVGLDERLRLPIETLPYYSDGAILLDAIEFDDFYNVTLHEIGFKLKEYEINGNTIKIVLEKEVTSPSHPSQSQR